MIHGIKRRIKNGAKRILHARIYRELVRLRGVFKGDEAYWILSLDDAIALDTIIKKHHVKKVLELGGGIGGGTLGMAWSLPPEGTIDYVEQVRQCVARAKELIPKEYQKKIRFHHSKTKLTEPFRYHTAISYAELPQGREEEYDMVVIDGPSFHVENGEFVTTLPRGDIFTLLPKLKDGAVIYIDGSAPTVKLLKRFYSHCLEKHSRYFIKRGDATEPYDGKKQALLDKGFTLE